MVEMLTHGLAGFGRPDSEKRWGANVFLQVLDPAAFAGKESFLRLMDDLTDRCHANAPIDPQTPVRMPGEMGQQLVPHEGGFGKAVQKHQHRAPAFARRPAAEGDAVGQLGGPGFDHGEMAG